ncbi:MAG: hypothetical protein TREMPRED_004715 [Tremellales sp. Tagirdzhanova-0007]|nr:MAG: hypothetical protein TREMPRED_004715 [Tremellales sp. Tagirdzhanova-0007]
MATVKASMRKWFPLEVFPIFTIVGLAVGGAGFYLFRLSQGSEVVWNRKGDWKPWDKVKQDQNLKLFTVNKAFWEQRKLAATQTSQRIVDMI